MQDAKTEEEIFICELERALSDFSGVEFESQTPAYAPLAFDFSLRTYSCEPGLKEFSLVFLEKVRRHFRMEGSNTFKRIPWDRLNTLKEELALSYIFNDYQEAPPKYECQKFLKNLVKIASKSYENHFADIGLMYLGGTGFDGRTQDFFEPMATVIPLEHPLSLEDFFLEKPFLRLIDGKSFNIVVDDSLKVGHLLIKRKKSEHVSEQMMEAFNKVRFAESWNGLVQTLGANVCPYQGVGELVLPVKPTDPFLRILEKRQVYCQGIQRLSGLVYFKADKGRIQVYVHKELNLIFEEGEWRIQNIHHFAQLLLRQIFESTLGFHLPSDQRPDEDSLSKVSDQVFERTIQFINLLKYLSDQRMSSIILIADGKLELEGEKVAGSTRRFLERFGSRIRRNRSEGLGQATRIGERPFNILDLSYETWQNICAVDGAVLFDSCFNLISFGEMVNSTGQGDLYGAGSAAANTLSQFGITIKVSSDGDIKVFKNSTQVLFL